VTRRAGRLSLFHLHQLRLLPAFAFGRRALHDHALHPISHSCRQIAASVPLHPTPPSEPARLSLSTLHRRAQHVCHRRRQPARRGQPRQG
jgi:hypothetical protein